MKLNKKLIITIISIIPNIVHAQTITLSVSGLGTEVSGEVSPGSSCLTGSGSGTSRTCTYGGWRSDFTPLIGTAQHACSCNTGYTFTSISPGGTCTYGGIQPVLVLPDGSTSNLSVHCFPGNTGPQGPAGEAALIGEIIDATGEVIPGSKTGRRHEPNSNSIGWDITVWSELDQAYWPINPQTGDVWPEESVGIDIGQGAYHIGGDCTGDLYVPYTPDNRVVWAEYGTVAYKAGGTYPSGSIFSCSVYQNEYCYVQSCPGPMLIAVEATHPPDLSSFTPPFKGGVESN